ncbi:MAG: YbaB/EbfC family nucleoid-associated protein [Proteobacteria bacterium]|nr:YbaB/EbfC family nucleoid-associated protein [Pseudomonadota bacterium]MBU1716764.1 YbaB/EbfC family nucleoid-associated protein [Pseudomonadota bacterium]
MDINQIMKQAQEFQQKMGQVQNELATKKVSSSVGGGMVSVIVNGRNELVELKIDREIINPEDPAMLQDLVMAAVNDAMRKAREMAQQEMSKLTGGLNIPGLT